MNFEQEINMIINYVKSLTNIIGLDNNTLNLMNQAAENSTFLNQPPEGSLTIEQNFKILNEKIFNLEIENKKLKAENFLT